jgi:hypothetical protein
MELSYNLNKYLAHDSKYFSLTIAILKRKKIIKFIYYCHWCQDTRIKTDQTCR